jgi:hypothetical protein
MVPRNALFASLMVLAFAPTAQAYIDPGAGSLVLQLIIGGIASALVTLKLFWRRLRSRAVGSSPKND